jgi:hypothetical protein
MVNENPISPDAQPVAGGGSGSIGNVFKVFTEPTSVFASLASKTAWLVPFLIMVVIGGGIYYYTRPIMTKDMKKSVLRNIEKYKDYLGAEKYEQAKQQIEEKFREAMENPFKWYYLPLFMGMPLVFLVIITGIGMLAGNFLFGGRANFWLVMGAVAYAALIGLLGDLVRAVLMLVKNTSYVYTGLGLLKPIDDGTFLYYLFRQVDVFTVWRIIVTAIGLGIVYKMKPKKFGIVLLSVWLVFVIIVSVLNIYAGGTIIY